MTDPVKRGVFVPAPPPERPAGAGERRTRPVPALPAGSIAAVEIQLGF